MAAVMAVSVMVTSESRKAPQYLDHFNTPLSDIDKTVLHK